MKTFLLLSYILLLCVSVSLAQQEAYWPLDADVTDSFGNFDGVAEATGVSFVTDDTRGAVMQLDGLTGFVTLPLGLCENVTDVTITCWFNWAGGDNWTRVYSFGYANSDQSVVRTLYFCPRDGWDPNKLHVTLGGPYGTWYDFVPDSIEADTWYFSAFVMSADTLRFYINDQLWADSVGVLYSLSELFPDSCNYIGKSHWADPTYNGMIDDLHFFPRALSEAELLELYNPSDINVSENKPADTFILNQNYPNPFNPTTNISYSIPDAGSVTLKIFDITGREISTLVNGFQTAGLHNVIYDASELAAGVYMYQLTADGINIDTKKMVLLK